MNKVILIGRLTKDPDIRVTTSGKTTATINLAIDDGKDRDGNKTSQYFVCKAWESQAGVINNFVKKGHRIAIVGKIQTDTWDKPDGTKGYLTYVLIRELELLTTKAEASANSEFATGPNQTYNPAPVQPQASQPPQSVQALNAGIPSDTLPDIDVDQIKVEMPF